MTVSVFSSPHVVLFSSSSVVSKQELVPFLVQQISEQKKVDATFSGAPLVAVTEGAQALVASKDAASPEVQLVLQSDAKKQRKQTKQMYMDRGKSLYVPRPIYRISYLS